MYERTFSGALGPYFAQIKQIGAGGNGRILSGVDTRFDFPVCIKRISVANKDECRATLREIRIRRRLRHENIVGLLNAIVSDGTDVSEITPVNFRDTGCIYLVQELLDADLRQVIESHTRLSDEYVKLFFYQLLRGLKYIHSANVLHCDLKPSNVMVNINSLQLMIGDFGHSVVLDPEYNHGNSLTVCATSLWYKAPELILGTGQYSTASDVWAVGCILAEMLLGRPLFEGENNLEQLELIIHTIKVDQKDQVYVREYLTEEANTMYSGEPKFPLQSKFQKVDSHALHLLEHLLSFNPGDRVTTELALSHPFLHEYACVADEPVCLKPLHLEHEVDDFLEYTLKDLIVGECVALAEEQPRIHLQMSSYCSLTDLTKESANSPCGSSSQSMDDTRASLELKTVSEDYQEMSNESEGNRFKVLEVLKEEHGSSSGDSNGLAAHEEGVSEAPLVLDHPMFSSSKWEKERYSSHKSGHRRHHHHRRKQSEEAKSRRRKIPQENKVQLRSPCSDFDPAFDANRSGRSGSLPEIRIAGDLTPENHVPRLNSLGDELSGSVSPKVEACSPVPISESSVVTEAQDDKVKELISRSRQLIADQAAVMNDVPALTDICGPVSSEESPEVPMEIEDEKCPKVKNFISSSVGDLSVLSHHRSAVDLGVTEVIRRSQELLGVTEVIRGSQELFGVTEVVRESEELGVAEVVRRSQELLGELYTPNAEEEKSLVRDESGSVQDLISRSEQLLKTNEIPELSTNTLEHSPCPPDEKTSLASYASDTVNGLISRSEQSLKSYQVTERLHTVDTLGNANTLQPMLSDPYHLKESNRRMQELLEESHTLLNSLKTDQTLCPEAESSPLNSCDGKNPCELANENLEDNDVFCERNATHFDESLAGIDLNEMKFVLDQAKNLLQKSNELSTGDVKESTAVDGSANAMEVEMNSLEKYTMEIDENTEGVECSDVKDSVAEVDFCRTPGLDKEESTTVKKEYESRRALSEGELKNLSCFQYQLVHIGTVPPTTSQQADIFEVIKVKVSPPLEQQALQCLSPSRGSLLCEESKSMNKTALDDLGKCTLEENDDFHGFEQVLVKKRSNDTLSDDNAHKHFKNSNVILADGTLSTADCDPVEVSDHSRISAVQSGEFDGEHLRLNGMKTSTLDLNVDRQLNTNCKVDLEPKNMQSGIDVSKLGKHSPKYETAYSNRMIDEINSDDVVDKICGTTCRNNAKLLNSKDSAGLQNFYATLKIKSIMRNRGRFHREKRHDTYPF